MKGISSKKTIELWTKLEKKKCWLQIYFQRSSQQTSRTTVPILPQYSYLQWKPTDQLIGSQENSQSASTLYKQISRSA